MPDSKVTPKRKPPVRVGPQVEEMTEDEIKKYREERHSRIAGEAVERRKAKDAAIRSTETPERHRRPRPPQPGAIGIDEPSLVDYLDHIIRMTHGDMIEAQTALSNLKGQIPDAVPDYARKLERLRANVLSTSAYFDAYQTLRFNLLGSRLAV